MSEKKPASPTPAGDDSSSDTEDTFPPKPLIIEHFKQVNPLKSAKLVHPGGDSYEGTVRDDLLPHGIGVYKASEGAVRYEGEWFQGHREGHGVLVAGSIALRYSGQWKHCKMHGCGVLELFGYSSKGRFYYNGFKEEDHGCDDVLELHTSIAEVAAAKARMFVNKHDADPEAESKLKENIKKLDDELKRLEKEVEKKMEMELEDEDLVVSRVEVKDEDESTPFGFVLKDQDSIKSDQNGKKGGKSSPFAAYSLSNASCDVASVVPSQVQQLFAAWKESKLQTRTSRPSSSFRFSQVLTGQCTRKSLVGFERMFDQGLTLRACHKVNKCITRSSLGNSFKKKTSAHVERNMCKPKSQRFSLPCIRPNEELSILSLHVPI